MKKLLALMMLCCLALFVVACGPKADDKPATGDANATGAENGESTETDGEKAEADEDEGQLEMMEDLGAAAPKSPTQPKDVDVDAPDPLKPIE